MSFKLPKLPYDPDYLEPVISSKTIEYHHGKHHQAYVNNLNKLTEGTDWANSDFENLIKGTEGGVYNNAAQVWNHAFYWECMTRDGNAEPDQALMKVIEEDIGNFDSFRNQFFQASVTLFGSGWAWLVKNQEGKLRIMQGPNAWNPLTEDLIPLLTIDVWEHAYYLDYQNRRPDYVDSFWKLIDWKKVSERYHNNAHMLTCC